MIIIGVDFILSFSKSLPRIRARASFRKSGIRSHGQSLVWSFSKRSFSDSPNDNYVSTGWSWIVSFAAFQYCFFPDQYARAAMMHTRACENP